MEHLFLLSVRALVMLFGLVIVYLSYKSYKKTQSRSLKFVSAGFTLVTLGSVIESLIYGLGFTDLLIAQSAESLIVLAGFAVLIYSLYVPEDISPLQQ